MKTMLLTLLAVLLSHSIAASCDYEAPVEGFTQEEIKIRVLRCVSERLEYMHTNASVSLLEDICYYQVINYENGGTNEN